SDGQACHDSDPCNGDETCQAGQCSPGTLLDCSTNLACQIGSCQTGVGCVLNPVADGTTCDNQDVCDGPDQCLGGQCQSIGPAIDCTDADPCTTDLCDPLTGCLSPPAPDGTSCTNHDPCDGEETCRSGVCTNGAPLDCDDQNSCTIDSCVPALRCKHEPFPDGDNCGRCGQCLDGVCDGDTNCASGCNSVTPTRTVSLLAVLMLVLSIFVRRKKE
ncbi:MAG: hypothetical protein JRJ87_17990, partial [Deltaproteobacteria bacterium]|nr:hypothetical protein [Deltaproteobacteria bacterium]